MKLKVLGCSGGIGSNLNTTAMLVDHDILIDAGTGVNALSLSELRAIDHIFVTHSHFDHITTIPLIIDSVGYLRDHPVTLYGTSETLEILRKHIFNWEIWPDFTVIPSPQHPFLRFQEVIVGEPVVLKGRSITPLPANHVVPAVGYHLDSGQASLVLSGDTTVNPPFWAYVNRIDNLRYLLIETAFSNKEKQVAVLAKHLCPDMLASELAQFTGDAEVFITHLKPGEVELIMSEVATCVKGAVPRMLLNNQEFEL